MFPFSFSRSILLLVIIVFAGSNQAKDITAPEITAQGFDISVAQEGVLHALSQAGDVRSLEDVEGDLIRFAIEHHGGRMTRVARSLDIGRSTLYRKLKELGIDAGEPRQTAKQAASG